MSLNRNLCVIACLLALALASLASAQVLINEVDADQLDTDSAEFVELYNAGASAVDLASGGYVLVLYNGNGAVSYGAYDLTGTIAAGDLFVIGAAAVPNVDLTPAGFPSTNAIQNGEDAVALYAGTTASAFPDGTAATAGSLVDALVYETGTDTDSGLDATLTPGQPIIDEHLNGDANTVDESMQRIPDGAGGALNTGSYDLSNPTPGLANGGASPPPPPPPPASSIDAVLLVPGSTIADANAVGDDAGDRFSSPEELAVLSNGNVAFLEDNSNGPSGDPAIGVEEIIVADLSTNPPTLTVLADENDLLTAISNAGGTPPASLTLRGIDEDANGDLIVYNSGGSEVSYLFNIDGATGAVEVITGLDAATPSIEGINALAVIGTTAYMAGTAFYGTPNGDVILSIDTTLTGGTTAATALTTQAEMDALGITYGVNDMAVNSDGNLVLCNSSFSSATDELLLYDITGDALSVWVDPADIIADLNAAGLAGVTDMGWNALAIDTAGASDVVYIQNDFGDGEAANGIVRLTNISGGAADAELFFSEADLTGDSSIVDEDFVDVTSLTPNVASMVVLEANVIALTDDNVDGVIKLFEPEITPVTAYELYR
ncbi:lamin tail domain-containing protein [Candidatus Sumerlaeota bacterium]|nr:lamin tail domain-containing protein [Candidatus Sumerlaeota bacterium]